MTGLSRRATVVCTLALVGCGEVPATAPVAPLRQSAAADVAPAPEQSAPLPMPEMSAAPHVVAAPAASTTAPPEPEPPQVDLVIELSNRRPVPGRFDPGATETLQHFAIHVKTQPPQTLDIGDLRQTACHLTRPVGAVVGAYCYAHAVGFSLRIEPAVRGLSRVVVDEGLESGKTLWKRSAGYLQLPPGHHLHLTIVDTTGVVDEGVVAPAAVLAP